MLHLFFCFVLFCFVLFCFVLFCFVFIIFLSCLVFLILSEEGYWAESANRRSYFDTFAKENSFDALIPENWYLVTREKLSTQKVTNKKKERRKREETRTKE